MIGGLLFLALLMALPTVLTAARMTNAAARRLGPLLIGSMAIHLSTLGAIVLAAFGASGPLADLIGLAAIAVLVTLFITAIAPPGEIGRDVERLWQLTKRFVQ